MKGLVWFLLTGIMGLGAIMIPELLFGQKGPDLNFFHIVTEGVENFYIFSMALLILSGAIPSVFHSGRVWVWGLAAVFLFPIIAIVEMTLVNPYSHNLWPIEFLVTYPFFALFGIVGAALGKLIKRKLPKTGLEF